jgi:hypothetical protein
MTTPEPALFIDGRLQSIYSLPNNALGRPEYAAARKWFEETALCRGIGVVADEWLVEYFRPQWSR